MRVGIGEAGIDPDEAERAGQAGNINREPGDDNGEERPNVIGSPKLAAS
jgi:hypothetical protein